jgi:hypothetical protein
LLFHGSNGFAKAPQCYVIRTLSVLSIIILFHKPLFFMFTFTFPITFRNLCYSLHPFFSSTGNLIHYFKFILSAHLKIIMHILLICSLVAHCLGHTTFLYSHYILNCYLFHSVKIFFKLIHTQYVTDDLTSSIEDVSSSVLNTKFQSVPHREHSPYPKEQSVICSGKWSVFIVRII